MRKDKILQVINEYCEKHTISDLKQGVDGISVYEISEKLNILRNNVSADVNRLFEEGKVIKICGEKMFKFYSSEHLKKLTKKVYPPKTTCENIRELLKDVKNTEVIQDDPFTALIGYNGSLKNAIISAKASILYPSGALHTLLLGESGVGKSLFAEKMYMFGKQEGIFKIKSEFVVFNCADYANNAELLLSQLFGSIKGAYTGADNTKEGLLKRADGGVLFLDEVHRLPPEGQEMLFYFIDKKKYRMLGEVNCEHTADVTLIMATTENPDNHLLTTFMRRIPMVIKIPNLKEKSLYEKKQLILYLFEKEAASIKSNIVIDKETMSNLMLYDPKGNIGQLKNDIKLAIARSYLEMRQNQEDRLIVHTYSLSYPVHNSFSDIDITQRKDLERILSQDTYVVEPYGIDIEEELNSITIFNPPVLGRSKTDIQDSFEQYVEKIAISLENNLQPSFIIDTEISEIMVFIHEWTLYNMNILIEKSQSAALAFYLKNIKENYQDAFSKNEDLKDYDIETIDKARQLIREIERNFNLRIPSYEVFTLACILRSFTQNTMDKTNISIFIVAHGESLATNIANVVNELLNIQYVIPVNMPLTKNVNQIIDELIEKINKQQKDNEIILFVDMGSLTTLETILHEKVPQKIVVVPTTNTLLVLDAARKAFFLNYSVSSILNDVLKMNQKLETILEHQIKTHIEQDSEKVIYTICYSGDGTAHYLEKYLKDILEEKGIFNIDIIALSNDSLIKIRNIIEETSLGKEVLCLIGNLDPGMTEYPFISIEDILISDGIDRLFTYIGNEDLIKDKKAITNFERDVFVDISFESVDKYLNYLNSKKLYPIIMKFIESIENEIEKKLDNRILVRMIVHVSCMVERLLFDEYKMTNKNEEHEEINEQINVYESIKNNLNILINAFNVEINEEECYFIYQILTSNDTY